MKILRIENGTGHFYSIPDQTWKPIDQIEKNSLLALLNYFLEYETEMDSPDEIKISNQAHKIIYSNIYEKLIALEDNKTQFKDESETLYLAELLKYSG